MKNNVNLIMKITGSPRDLGRVIFLISLKDSPINIINATEQCYFNGHEINQIISGNYECSEDFEHDKNKINEISKNHNVIIEIFADDNSENISNHVMFKFGNKEYDDYKSFYIVNEDDVDKWNDNHNNKITEFDQCDSNGNYYVGGFNLKFENVNNLIS